MTFARLLDYYEKIKDIDENLHLVKVFESSHASSFAIPEDIEQDLIQTISDINEGRAPKRAAYAYEKINEMLLEDGTDATFSSETNNNVIQFPGRP